MARTKKKEEATLYDLFLMKLQSLYYIEHELMKTLPKMASKATDLDLKKGFRDHLDETRAQAARLETIFESLEEKPRKLKSEGIDGIIADSAWVMKNVTDSEALDASLVAAASYAEHYEMAGYMSALRWADNLGYEDAASLLEETLAEEEAADEKLADLAEEKLDERVLPESEEEDAEE